MGRPTDEELDQQIDHATCDGLLVGRVVDSEGNLLNCYETDEPVDDWCMTCVLVERLSRLLAKPKGAE